MHLFNDNSPLTPFGQGMVLLCPKPDFDSRLYTHYIGIEFLEANIEGLSHYLFIDYLTNFYTGPINVGSFYAEMLKDIPSLYSAMANDIAEQIFTSSELAEDTHATWEEHVINFFDHDFESMFNALIDMIRRLHTVLYFPIMHVISVNFKAGLTISPTFIQSLKNTIRLEMEVLDAEQSYYEYEPEYHGHTPHGLGIPPVRTTSQIGQNVVRSGPTPVPSLVRSHRTRTS